MVTPQIAELWLQNNTKNRKVRQHHVDKLAAEMLAGKWVLNGQTISFSPDMILLDGQHRLLAVIQSGMTVPMSIVIGISDPNAFKTYDVTILKRGVDQLASMSGIENAKSASAIARRLLYWDSTNDKTKFNLTNDSFSKINNSEVLNYLEKHNDEIQSLFKEMSQTLPHRKCQAGSALIAALIICNRIDETATYDFIDGLKEGMGFKKGSPIGHLRDRLVDPPERRGMKWETEVMALTIKAWNKHLCGKTLKQFRWRQEGDAPELFPVPGDKKWLR
jgi:hypothetical protein